MRRVRCQPVRARRRRGPRAASRRHQQRRPPRQRRPPSLQRAMAMLRPRDGRLRPLQRRRRRPRPSRQLHRQLPPHPGRLPARCRGLRVRQPGRPPGPIGAVSLRRIKPRRLSRTRASRARVSRAQASRAQASRARASRPLRPGRPHGRSSGDRCPVRVHVRRHPVGATRPPDRTRRGDQINRDVGRISRGVPMVQLVREAPALRARLSPAPGLVPVAPAACRVPPRAHVAPAARLVRATIRSPPRRAWVSPGQDARATPAVPVVLVRRPAAAVARGPVVPAVLVPVCPACPAPTRR